jgi:hypothetical protein
MRNSEMEPLRKGFTSDAVRLPFLSTWGDGGTGTAVLYIEVAIVHPKAYELRYQGKPYYLPKTAIPSTARLINGAEVQSAGD